MDLSAVRVLDLTQLLPGPYATQLLADLGAEVTKIERPNGGDPARRLADDPAPDIAGIFDAVNRGKQSVALDLTDPLAQETFYELAADADAVIEGFRPGVVDRLGVDYETLSQHAPELVYCSLTGHGQTGPDSDRAGHDLTYAAAAGVLDATRPAPDAKPTLPGVPVGDMAGGSLAALAVVSGLLDRELGAGGGTYIDLSITDALVSFTQLLAPPAGDRIAAAETVLGGKYPCYELYETADDRWIAIAALEPRFWTALCEAIGADELAAHHRAETEDKREHVRSSLAAIFAEASLETWTARLSAADVPFAPVRSAAAAIDDPAIRDRLVWDRASEPRVGLPLQAAGAEPTSAATTPALGEHTTAVLEAAGVEEETRAELRNRDAVAGDR